MSRNACACRFVLLVLLLAQAGSLAGCNIFGFFGVLEQERRRQSTRKVEAEYRGLEGQKVAVIVDADRELAMTYPSIDEVVHANITERLRANVPGIEIMSTNEIERIMFNEPALLGRTYDEIAERLEVDRLVVIQLEEFQLFEPGNEYVWDGRVSGVVLVIEADSFIEEDVRLEEFVTVGFPDLPNVTRDELPGSTMADQLVRRFSNRSAWFFYDHRERYEEFQEY
ncbi:MAG: hypothetical protein AAFX79_06310 [Planctomycetota bacterium]